LGRAETRKARKNVKKKLTKTQYEHFQKATNVEFLNSQIKEKTNKLSLVMSEVITDVLKNNRISDQRVKKIVNEICTEVDRRFSHEEIKEGIPE
jgi:glycerol-3-phosphate O-acyltransferase